MHKELKYIASNWKIVNNINEKSWFQTFETLLSLEQMSNSIDATSHVNWQQIKLRFTTLPCPD